MGNNPNYKVGYKHPPVETQFKKGQAFKRARPREVQRDLSFPAIIDRMLDRRVDFPDGGEVPSMTMIELITRRMLAKAGSGDHAAGRLLKRLNNLKRERGKRQERQYIVKIDGVEKDEWLKARQAAKKKE